MKAPLNPEHTDNHAYDIAGARVKHETDMAALKE
jgi:hypothetical protein